MNHHLLEVDLYAADEVIEQEIDTKTQCVWCTASGQWKRSSDRLFIAYLNAEDDLQLIFRRWAQPIIELAEHRDMPEGHLSLINDLIVQIEWIVEDPVHDSEPYLRDQFYGFIQLITTLTLESLAETRLDRDCQWLDIRDIFKATDVYGSASLLNTDKSFHQLEEHVQEDQTLFLAWNVASTTMNDSVSLAPESLQQIKEYFDIPEDGSEVRK